MNLNRLTVLSTLASIALAAPAAPGAMATTGDSASASFVDMSGKQVGKASLSEMPNGVLIQVELRGLPPGEHAFHIHGTGKCDPSTGFKSAGDHFAPGGHKHGYRAEGGPHAGDMPNQLAGKDGMLKADVVDPRVTLTRGEAGLLDADGSALVVHAKADDYRSQPSGDAGDRLACAVIRR